MNRISMGTLSRSLSTRLIPTTNRKNEHPHEISLENGKKQSRFTVIDSRKQGTKQLLFSPLTPCGEYKAHSLFHDRWQFLSCTQHASDIP